MLESVVKIWADTALANKELGWKASLSLYDIMRSAWKWEQHLAQKNKVKV